MKIAPTWMNVSLGMKNDPQTDKAFGWVLEMYIHSSTLLCRQVLNLQCYIKNAMFDICYKVCICCFVGVTWCEQHSTQRLHDSGFDQ